MFLPVGAQPESIKLSHSFLSSAELCVALIGGSAVLGCPGGVALGAVSAWHRAAAAAGLLSEMALLIIFPLLAWDW